MNSRTHLFAVILSLTVFMGNNQANVEVNSAILHLTPYIDNGQIELGRQLSLVTHVVIPRSHAGFITVDKQLGNHLFFWFFPAINSDPQSPLLVWLNGGPGISSMVGLFYENGPLRLGVSEEETIYFMRWTKSWAENVSMLYIDQPVGVGYSYTENELNGYRFNQEGCAGDLYEFIKQFYLLFPDYTSRDLYLGGQSYAGSYIPAFAYRIHTDISAGRSTIPLTGIYLGGPLFDVKTQSRESARFFEILGVMSKNQVDEFYLNFDNFMENLSLTGLSFQGLHGIISPLIATENYLTLQFFPMNNLTC